MFGFAALVAAATTACAWIFVFFGSYWYRLKQHRD